MFENSIQNSDPERESGASRSEAMAVWIPLRPVGRQGELLHVLEQLDRSGQLPGVYWAAVTLLRESRFPGRLPLAGHAIRELMEKVPRYGDFVLAGQHQSKAANLQDQVKKLRIRWINLKANGGLRESPTPGHHLISKPFCDALGRFFDNEVGRSKNEATDRALALLDPSRQRLPEQLQREMREEWLGAFGYFSGVSHHQKVTSEAEFLERLAWVEAFLLDRLRPRTFESQLSIDRAIEEAERA